MSLSLPQNSQDWQMVTAVQSLALSLYTAICDAKGKPRKDWRALSLGEQQMWEEQAKAWIEKFDVYQGTPEIVTGMRGKVIGAIGLTAPAPQTTTWTQPAVGLSRCIFCGDECENDDHYPYCSARCGIASEADR